MFAGSVKDVCRADWGERLISYAPIPKDVREFDVLNTPSAEGLHDGEFIFIKDIKSRLQERPKVVADLLLEASHLGFSLDIIDIKFPEKVPRGFIYKFTVHRLGSPRREISVEV